MSESIPEVARLIASATSVVALTGAGLSTGSGIPDYRTPGKGIWEDHDPAEVAHIRRFRKDPQPFFQAYRKLGGALLSARPNAGHQALVALEELGRLTAVITQNIDSLHTLAGSRTVLELHGSLRTGSCVGCGRTLPFRPFMKRLIEHDEIPCCQVCGEVIKPDVVFFGEYLDPVVLASAEGHAARAEVILCCGSSLVVQPAAMLPLLTRESGGRIVICNRDETELDDAADHLLRGDVAETLPALAAAVADYLQQEA